MEIIDRLINDVEQATERGDRIVRMGDALAEMVLEKADGGDTQNELVAIIMKVADCAIAARKRGVTPLYVRRAREES